MPGSPSQHIDITRAKWIPYWWNWLTSRTAADAKAMAMHSKGALDSIRNFPVPVVAALNGDALGGGSEVAVACDFRVAAAHARLGFVQGRLNVTSAWGGGIDLMNIVGPTRGLELLAQGRMVGGGEALGLGLIDAVADDGESLDDALDRFLDPLEAPETPGHAGLQGVGERRPRRPAAAPAGDPGDRYVRRCLDA